VALKPRGCKYETTNLTFTLLHVRLKRIIEIYKNDKIKQIKEQEKIKIKNCELFYIDK